MKVALIDYHKGNITSVARAFEDVGAKVRVTDSCEEVASSDAIVLPGVGAFTDAMATLDSLGLSNAIKEKVDAGAPFLGICLGMHLMFDAGYEHSSSEGPTPGLGFLPGVVDKMPHTGEAGTIYKIPHVGWNTIEPASLISDSSKLGRDSYYASDDFGIDLLSGIAQGEYFYFTHSYISPISAFTVAETTHSVTFPSIVAKGRAFGVQFHPEKSSVAGLKLIQNFVNAACE